MSHFVLVRTDEIMNGPVDYSAPIGDVAVFRCSNTVRDYIERRKPVARRFQCNPSCNAVFFSKFIAHTGYNSDFIEYARNAAGVWYVEAVFL